MPLALLLALMAGCDSESEILVRAVAGAFACTFGGPVGCAFYLATSTLAAWEVEAELNAGELPERVPIGKDALGLTRYAYPGLVAEGQTAAVRHLPG